MDTFNRSQKIQVHKYDGSFEYHPVHIRNQTLTEYYEMFGRSDMYAVWQNENENENENVIENENENEKGEENFPTIKYRSFTDAFCPCCLDQKQRDCANHVQVSLINVLKVLGNLRRLHGISDAIKSCGCNAHRNENYLICPTSVAAFTDAIACPRIEYPTLSSLDREAISIKEQEDDNIRTSNEKEDVKKMKGETNENRNSHREGPTRQKKLIVLVSWGGLFKCHKRNVLIKNVKIAVFENSSMRAICATQKEIYIFK